ncbi:MAG: hypothetical protein U0401_09720 [Anaerolineae bacterium]
MAWAISKKRYWPPARAATSPVQLIAQHRKVDPGVMQHGGDGAGGSLALGSKA